MGLGAHCEAIWEILTKGKINETYLVGANCEKSNLQVIMSICNALNKEYTSSVKFVKDRAGHDYRYAIDPSKIQKELMEMIRSRPNDAIPKLDQVGM